MYAILYQKHLQLFDLLDMVSLVGMSNKDHLVRVISCLLVTESGKLKRLLIKESRDFLSDILYSEKETLKKSLQQKLLIFDSFKGHGLRDSA
jgi:hypothetical protein